MKYGLALEGGGAKGAHQVGVVKALIDNGYEFDIVTGTSIGAISGAMIAQNDFEKLYEIWSKLNISDIVDIDDDRLKRISSRSFDLDLLKYVSNKMGLVMKNKGIDTSKIRSIISAHIDEEKLRKSPIDFGMITYNLTDRKPVEVYKDDIPQGMLTEYIMASANLPIFKLEPIDGKTYVDGGVYDNLPINLLIDRGCKNIVAIKTYGIGINRKFNSDGINIITIGPSENIGNILNFGTVNLKQSLKMGYMDGLRAVKNLRGFKYYIEPTTEKKAFSKIIEIDEDVLVNISNTIDISGMEPKKLFLEKTLPYILRKIGYKDSKNYQDALIKIMEYVAESGNVYKYKIYTFNGYINLLKHNIETVERKNINNLMKACIELVKHL